MRIELQWPWDKARRDAQAAAADAQQAAREAEAAWRRALQCALAAGEAAGVARVGGQETGSGRGVDPDLETLDTHTSTHFR